MRHFTVVLDRGHCKNRSQDFQLCIPDVHVVHLYVDLLPVAVSRGFVHPRALLAIPDRRLDAPDLMSGTHITGHDAKQLVISDPGDLCTLVLFSPSQTVTTFRAIDITEYSSLGVVL